MSRPSRMLSPDPAQPQRLSLPSTSRASLKRRAGEPAASFDHLVSLRKKRHPILER
jgi:hypothetical protein